MDSDAKINSPKAVLESNDTRIALIAETKLPGNNTINVQEYKWIGKTERKNGGMVAYSSPKLNK